MAMSAKELMPRAICFHKAYGRYTIQGMRVGGPYTITISYIGFKDEVKKNISLTLGESSVINADLKEDEHTLGEVIVFGCGRKGRHGCCFKLQSKTD